MAGRDLGADGCGSARPPHRSAGPVCIPAPWWKTLTAWRCGSRGEAASSAEWSCGRPPRPAPAEPGSQMTRGQTPTSLPSLEHSPHPKSTSATCVAARCSWHRPTSRSNSHRLSGGDGGLRAPLRGRVPRSCVAAPALRASRGADRALCLLPKSLPLSVPAVDSAL